MSVENNDFSLEKKKIIFEIVKDTYLKVTRDTKANYIFQQLFLSEDNSIIISSLYKECLYSYSALLNFINYESDKSLIDCSKIKFNLKSFYESKLFDEYKELFLLHIKTEKDSLEERLNNIKSDLKLLDIEL